MDARELIAANRYMVLATADAAADGLRGFYELDYPDVAAKDGAEIDAAISEIKVLYRLAATPAMKVTARTYPDDLGHMDFPGCFRCHDGGHYLVKDGKVTNEVIPSTCDTCHTFPQIGGQGASPPPGVPPAPHHAPPHRIAPHGSGANHRPRRSRHGAANTGRE